MAVWDELLVPSDGHTSDSAAYREGYARMMREVSWARGRGWLPTERQLVLALGQAGRVYATVRGGKSVGGQRPEWVHGRMDALRALLRNGVGAVPADERGAPLGDADDE
ncbi:MAG: hypothetical protein ACHQ4H_05990 [Ktedonobacterales bacterium]